jgi:hypothetical protein
MLRISAVAFGVVMALVAGVVLANVPLIQLSSDPFTNPSSQHRTEVEPATLSFGNAIISAFQVGRFFDGGSSDIGWATSLDGGSTWANGFLPGITKVQNPANPYDRASDPAVALDLKHGVVLISTLAIVTSGGGVNGAAVVVNRSADGVNWSNPVVVAAAAPGQNFDKEWVVCDFVSSSPFYGNCYVEWDDNGRGNLILMSTSHDGGATWGPAMPTANLATGLGGQPLVQPYTGTVIVPIDNANESAVQSFVSTNGGASWSAAVPVSPIISHTVAGNLRTSPLISAEIDGGGKVYAVWQDCRFRALCTANDIVMTTSTNGLVWSPVTRIPIDATTSGVDHFIPGMGVDMFTAGATTRLGLTYYFYPTANCTAATCQLNVGYLSSSNGGATWTPPTQLTGPMNLSWLANTSQGRMVGDYIATSFNAAHLAHGAFAVATAPSGATFNEGIFTTTAALTRAAPAVAASEQVPAKPDPVLSTASDRAVPAIATTRR